MIYVTEKEWAKTIRDLLIEKLDPKGEKYWIEVEVPLCFNCNLNSDFRNVRETDNSIRNIDIKNANAQTWNVDLLIAEKIKNKNEIKLIPRVVLEAKYNDINLHGPITYNYNAGLHKQLYPGLKYGFIIGNYSKDIKRESDISKQLISQGNNFDFIFVFNKSILSKKEEDKFIGVVENNIKTARSLANFLSEKTTKDRVKNWYYIKNSEFSNYE